MKLHRERAWLPVIIGHAVPEPLVRAWQALSPLFYPFPSFSTLEATSTRQHELAAMIIHRGIGA